jgi:hypothetical protein
LWGVSANGLRAGSGFTVGLVGAALGLRSSLALSAAALCAGSAIAGFYALRRRRSTAPNPNDRSLAAK